MAKLYAELTSDKGGRVTSKSGNEYITVLFTENNRQVVKCTVGYTSGKLTLQTTTVKNGLKTTQLT